eukprot:TRINITY_DN3512_c1_g7_i1.p1 TRINITY_DN3512_c1_g7~~TRINITY_DN3512_c1_g7_i1.p1  ORF type:complete len:1179 (-),score=292.00 TRINITY_DN3512_c1_g7_i1:130-3666(-)
MREKTVSKLCILLTLFCATVFGFTHVDLYQSDFVNGTYRILEPGEYHIREDINFGPLPENDYWNDPADRHYPIANYYMGFFAAITIEVDDVELYLNGHTIQQTEEFYLMQRFFNVIQLNDKVFVHNEGVSSLNYQNADNVTYVHSHIVGDLVTVQNVLIDGGVIGRSSHIGIHGNGAKGVTIRNVHIRDFEVAGIQCNGCKRVIIDKCEIGPSSREVTALATFSNARFIDLFGNRIIPYGFARDHEYSSVLLPLLDEEIQFADRSESKSIRQILERVGEAVRLYKNYIFGTMSDSLSVEEENLLQEARKVFNNPTGLPDGSVIYGILINKLGTPNPDDNFFGSGYESGNVVIKSTNIHGLHARPQMVPGLKTVNGDFIQGSSRDVLRIFDSVSDQFRTLKRSRYAGNFLTDSYFALWKLSNSFYKNRVFDSPCGNFGTNATMPYAINPYHADECLGGVSKDPKMTGRMATLFNKRYFGGLTISQGVYDWATTPGMSIDQILASRFAAPETRKHKHYIDCSGDNMFHPMQGVIGLKIVETNDIVVKRVDISDLYNVGDLTTWVCNQKWKLPETGEIIMPQSTKVSGAHIRGVEVVMSDNVQFNRVAVRDLWSDEGNVYGFQIIDDSSDRTDYETGDGISFEFSSVNNMTSGGTSIGFDHQGSAVSPSKGLTIGNQEELHNGFDDPKTSILYGFSYVQHPDSGYMSPGAYPVGDIFEFAKSTSKFTNDQKLLEFRSKGLNYFEVYYGLKFSEYENAGLNDPIYIYHQDGTVSDSLISWFAYSKDMEYHAISVCNGNQCSDLLSNSLVIDVGMVLFVGTQGLELHGTFGDSEGQYAPPGTAIFAGYYSFENVEFNGEFYDNIEIEYYPACPITGNFWSDGATLEQTIIVNCELESTLFGKGLATGTLLYKYVAPEGSDPYWNVTGYNVMVFDDHVDFPEESQVNTDLSGDQTFPSTIFAVWADGILPGDESLHIFPLLKSYHYTDESAIKYLKGSTSYNTDEKIFELRKQFLYRILNEYGIPVNPEGFDNIPLDGVVDLGGGNRIQAYEVNDEANFRILSRADLASQSAGVMPKGSRVREAGFRLVFGRAGMNTKWGHLPQGTILTEGVYILENIESDDSKTEVQFHSHHPLISDWWSSGVITNHVFSERFGNGLAQIAVTMPMPQNGKYHINVRGSIHFD